MKIMTNSIKKGKKFEREIAKRLSKLTGKEFLRVPMSGGFSTSFKTRTLKGDVFSEAEDYKDVVVECKIRKNPIKIGDLTSKKSELWDWIEQTEREALSSPSILFFRWNNSKKTFGITSSTRLAFKFLKNPLLFSNNFRIILNEWESVKLKHFYWLGELL